jgi:hypothetical protein
MKTAVEFIVEELEKSIQSSNQIAIGLILEKAKEMEKEEKKELIIATYTDLKMKDCQLPYGVEYHNKLLKALEEAEQYYNETFKQQEQ